MSLPGPSRRIVVQPLDNPAMPDPVRQDPPEPVPAREPEPGNEPAREPVPVS